MAGETRETQRIAVVGAGTMGSGIAQVAAVAGFDVALCDVSADALARGVERIRVGLDKAVLKGKLAPDARDAARTRVRTTTNLADAVRDAELVIEAVFEDLELKRRTFSEIARHAPPHAVLATNTSALPVARIAEGASDPSRVVGMHFFNPVPAMELLEIVRAASTGDAAIAIARAAGERMGKRCIVVRDTPGFATSRLGVLLGAEAMRMLEAGVACAEDIDAAMEFGYRHPMGPLKLTDLVGLDVRLAILEHLHRELGESFRPPEILRRMVAVGKLGKKSGQGFYTW